MKTSSCKAKGRNLQNLVCGVIRQMFSLSEVDVKPAIMGESGMDVKLSAAARKVFPFSVECKNTEKLNVWAAWNQAEANADKEGLVPMLIIKRNHSKPLMILDADQGMVLLADRMKLLEGS